VFEEWMELNHETYFASALPIDCPNGHYERMLQVADTLEGQLLELVRQGRARGNDRRDVLTILLHARDSGFMTDAELVGQLHTLFNAAYHTTTSALTWTVFLLAQHPRVMRELLAELHGHLHGQAPTNPQLARMSLLDRVIKESMRLLPPVVYAPRVNMVPINLGPYHLPKGTMVVTSHYITHHMPELFPQPERFLPDRWLHSNPSPYAYMPFGAGPRMCIGAPFATLMLKVAVAILFQRFRLSVVPGAQIDRQCTLTLGPRDGIPMTIWRQDRQFSTSPVQGNIHDMVHFPPYEERPAAAA
ncbi:MAG: cytochrome P450, partial [Gemmataceae bacterium]